jgi:hypothetical protein
MATPEMQGVPPPQRDSRIRNIMSALRRLFYDFAHKLQGFNDWVSKHLHFPAWLSGQLVKLEIIGLLGAGTQMIQLEEYALAIAFWFVAALMWFAKAVSWNGLPDRTFARRTIKSFHALFVVAVFVLLVVWTDLKRGDNSWTALQKLWAIKPIATNMPPAPPLTASPSPSPTASPTPTASRTPSTKPSPTAEAPKQSNASDTSDLQPNIGLETGADSIFDKCTNSGTKCFSEAGTDGKTLDADFHGTDSARIAVLLSVFPSTEPAADYAEEVHASITATQDVGLDYAGKKKNPFENTIEFTDDLVGITTKTQAPQQYLIDVSLHSMLTKVPLTITVWGRNMKRHTVRTNILVRNAAQSVPKNTIAQEVATPTPPTPTPTPSLTPIPTPAPIQRVDWRDKQNWRKFVHIGMTTSEVRQLFGEPEEVSGMSDSEYWDYGKGARIIFTKGIIRAWYEPRQ